MKSSQDNSTAHLGDMQRRRMQGGQGWIWLRKSRHSGFEILMVLPCQTG